MKRQTICEYLDDTFPICRCAGNALRAPNAQLMQAYRRADPEPHHFQQLATPSAEGWVASKWSDDGIWPIS